MLDSHPWKRSIAKAYFEVGGEPSTLPVFLHLKPEQTDQAAESLAMCQARVVKYLNNVIKPQLKLRHTVLVSNWPFSSPRGESR